MSRFIQREYWSEPRAHEGRSVLCARFNSNGSHFVSGGDDKTVRIWKFVGSSDVLKKYADDSSDQTSHETAHVHTFKGHGYPVQAVDISKDNTTIASAGGDRDVFLFDVEGNLKRRLKTHKAAISSLSFNTLDDVLISGSYDRTACLWDFRTNSGRRYKFLRTLRTQS